MRRGRELAEVERGEEVLRGVGDEGGVCVAQLDRRGSKGAARVGVQRCWLQSQESGCCCCCSGCCCAIGLLLIGGDDMVVPVWRRSRCRNAGAGCLRLCC